MNATTITRLGYLYALLAVAWLVGHYIQYVPQTFMQWPLIVAALFTLLAVFRSSAAALGVETRRDRRRARRVSRCTNPTA